jgi:hypothetical protein
MDLVEQFVRFGPSVSGDRCALTIERRCSMVLHMGPTDAADALRWIQEAVANGRYITHPHIQKRFVERRISLWELKQAARAATSCAPV